jgi:hypothetical protein
VPAHPGCCKLAPLWPHFVQRARCRSRSLDVSAPHRIISGTSAIGAWCKHFSDPSPAVAALKLPQRRTRPWRLSLGVGPATPRQPARHGGPARTDTILNLVPRAHRRPGGYTSTAPRSARCAYNPRPGNDGQRSGRPSPGCRKAWSNTGKALSRGAVRLGKGRRPGKPRPLVRFVACWRGSRELSV